MWNPWDYASWTSHYRKYRPRALKLHCETCVPFALRPHLPPATPITEHGKGIQWCLFLGHTGLPLLGDLDLQSPHSLYWNFLIDNINGQARSLSSRSHLADCNFGVRWALPLATISSQRGVFSNKILACLIPYWCLLIGSVRQEKWYQNWSEQMSRKMKIWD